MFTYIILVPHWVGREDYVPSREFDFWGAKLYKYLVTRTINALQENLCTERCYLHVINSLTIKLHQHSFFNEIFHLIR